MVAQARAWLIAPALLMPGAAGAAQSAQEPEPVPAQSVSATVPAPDSIPQPTAPAEAAYWHGLDLLASGDARGAVSSFQAALARGYRPPMEPYLRLGLAHKRIPLHKFQAIRAFRQVIRADPGALEALYEFADTYLSLDGWEAQREARRALVAIVELDPFYRDAFARWQSLYPYAGENRGVARSLRARLQGSFDPRVAALAAKLYLQVDEKDDLSDLLQDWSLQGGGRTSAYEYYRARLLFLEGRDGEATASFRSALDDVRVDEDLEPFWEDLEPLIGEDDHELADLRTLGGRVAFIRAFWEARDPLPFSTANERLAEQYRRVAEVRRRYLWKKPLAKERVIGRYVDDLGRPSFDTRLEGRSLDDRGTIYLRHGEPDARQIEIGGDEYWRYDRAELPGGKLQFHFKLMEGPMGRGNDTVYSILPTTEVGEANVRRGHAGQEGVENTLLGLQTNTYRFDYGKKILPLAASGATFRNAESRERTDLLMAVGVPLATVRVFEGEGEAQLVQRLKLYDGEYREELVLNDTLAIGPEEARAGVLVGAFQISSYPGDRRYALQIDARRSGALGLQRGDLVFPSYAERALQLSDVLFASRVSPAADDPHAPEREGYAIRPLLTGGLDRARPLHLYYEIYDLPAGDDGRARYRVEYRVRADERVQRSLLNRIFGGASGTGGEGAQEGEEVALAFEKERPGPAERVGETISLDLSALPVGRYRVVVTVRDLTSETEAARVVVLDLRDVNRDVDGEQR